MKKIIVITGGNGFLGSQITNALLNEKANVYIIDIKEPKKSPGKNSTSYSRGIPRPGARLLQEGAKSQLAHRGFSYVHMSRRSGNDNRVV